MNQNEFQIIVKKDEVICRDGDVSRDLYKVISGELLVCKRNNHMVTPLAYLKDGDYFGEMSFFDKFERSADVIATKKTSLVKIPSEELEKQFPNWLGTLSRSMTKKLRKINQILSNRGIKRIDKELTPLSIDEQRHIYSLLVP